jgi:hypothetical protein
MGRQTPTHSTGVDEPVAVARLDGDMLEVPVALTLALCVDDPDVEAVCAADAVSVLAPEPDAVKEAIGLDDSMDERVPGAEAVTVPRDEVDIAPGDTVTVALALSCWGMVRPTRWQSPCARRWRWRTRRATQSGRAVPAPLAVPEPVPVAEEEVLGDPVTDRVEEAVADDDTDQDSVAVRLGAVLTWSWRTRRTRTRYRGGWG